MTFYMIHSENNDLRYDDNILGEVSFKIFYPCGGFDILRKLVQTNSEKLNIIKIFDNNKKTYTVESFLKQIQKYKIFK